MFFSRLFFFPLIIFIFVSSIPAQSADEKKDDDARQIALLEQISKEVQSLQLPENRAIVFAKLGNGFWRFDEKRARDFFQNSVNELIAAQTRVENDKRQSNLYYGLGNGTSPRQEILNIIAARDAEFALEAFYRSRPAKMAQALAELGNKKKTNNQQYAQTEITFEQSLITRVSEQNPQRAMKLLRESLAKGVTYEAIALIEKLKTQDYDAANQLAADIAAKFLEADFEKNNDAFNYSASFVAEYGKKPEPEDEKPIKIDEKTLRDLTSKVAVAVLKSDDEYAYLIENILPIAEKYDSQHYNALKQKLAKLQNNDEQKEYAAYSKLIEDNASPEKMLAEADKFSDDFRNQIYYAAAEKSAQGGNLEQAKKIISSKLSDADTDNYLAQINYSLIAQAMSDGKFDEANLLINQIPVDATRFNLLLQLASTIYRKNPAENKKQALALADQARALIPQPTETLEDMSNLLQLAITVSDIEPEQSFQIAESLIYPLNEFLEASAIVAKYRNDGTLRQGEMIISLYGGVSGTQNLYPILIQLKDKDFKRTVDLINNFQRPEVRLGLQIQMIKDAPVADVKISIPSGTSGGSTPPPPTPPRK